MPVYKDPETHHGFAQITYSCADSLKKALESNADSISLDERVVRMKKVIPGSVADHRPLHFCRPCSHCRIPLICAGANTVKKFGEEDSQNHAQLHSSTQPQTSSGNSHLLLTLQNNDDGDIYENNKRMDGSNFILEVTNIPYLRKQSEVKEFFEQFENMVAFDMPTFNSDPERHRGIAHITFSSADSFKKALTSSVEALSVYGRKIRLKRVFSDSNLWSVHKERTRNFHEAPPTPKIKTGPCHDERDKKYDGSRHSHQSTLHQHDTIKKKRTGPNYVLTIPDIPITLTQSEVRAYFEQF